MGQIRQQQDSGDEERMAKVIEEYNEDRATAPKSKYEDAPGHEYD